MNVVKSKYNMCLQNVVEWKCKVAEHGNTQVKYLKYTSKNALGRDTTN